MIRQSPFTAQTLLLFGTWYLRKRYILPSSLICMVRRTSRRHRVWASRSPQRRLLDAQILRVPFERLLNLFKLFDRTLLDLKQSSMNDTRDIKQCLVQYRALKRRRQYRTLYSQLLPQDACSDHSYLVLVSKTSTYY